MEYKQATSFESKGKQYWVHTKWSPLGRGVIKINVDAAVRTDDSRIGIGIVARDSSGAVILSAAKSSWPFISVERAELEAFKFAIDIIGEYKWSHVIVEGDAQNVVNALSAKLKRGGHTQVEVDNIIFSVSKLIGISFSFCLREANSISHCLARRALMSICSSVWVDGGPIRISDLVHLDSSFY